MALVGDRVPDFTLPLATATGIDRFRLANHLGKGPIVISAYPLAFTSTCTEQVCDMRDGLAAFRDLDALVLGYSIDTPYANRAFARANGLRFGLLSDPNREVLDLLGLRDAEVVGVRDVAKRAVLVLDATGTVRHRWVTDDPDVWPGLEEVHRAVDAARSGT